MVKRFCFIISLLFIVLKASSTENTYQVDSIQVTLQDSLLTFSGSGTITLNFYNHYTLSQIKSVKKVVINEGITCIRKYAFSYFNNLTSITMPNSITTIEEDAFNSCI